MTEHAVEGIGKLAKLVFGIEHGPQVGVAVGDRVADISQMVERFEYEISHDRVQDIQGHGDNQHAQRNDDGRDVRCALLGLQSRHADLDDAKRVLLGQAIGIFIGRHVECLVHGGMAGHAVRSRKDRRVVDVATVGRTGFP